MNLLCAPLSSLLMVPPPPLTSQWSVPFKLGLKTATRAEPRKEKKKRQAALAANGRTVQCVLALGSLRNHFLKTVHLETCSAVGTTYPLPSIPPCGRSQRAALEAESELKPCESGPMLRDRDHPRVLLCSLDMSSGQCSDAACCSDLKVSFMLKIQTSHQDYKPWDKPRPNSAAFTAHTHMLLLIILL